MKFLSSLSLVLVLCLVLATAAFGQSSIQGYNDEARQIQAQVEEGGSLPITGLDVVLLVGAGGLLVVVGLAWRRLTRAPGPA